MTARQMIAAGLRDGRRWTRREAWNRLFRPHWRNPEPVDEPRTAEQRLRDIARSGR